MRPKIDTVSIIFGAAAILMPFATRLGCCHEPAFGGIAMKRLFTALLISTFACGMLNAQ